MSQFTITFSANCCISQLIKPFEGYSKEDILEGLNSGEYLTTLGHNGLYGNVLIYKLPSFTPVATIVSQTVEDSEYYDFTGCSEQEFEDEDA